MGMDTLPSSSIAAIIAAAGFSRRMGRFKQLLPWGDSTVIRTVVHNLHAAGADPIVCVTGHRADEVTSALDGSPACTVHNPHYTTGEMRSSYQAGIAAIHNSQFTVHHSLFCGSLLVLADQPHISVDIIRQVITQARTTPEQIVIPSHAIRRGHPIYLPRRLWAELLDLPPGASLRDLLNRNSDKIVYVNVDTHASRRDMDEWGEYEKLQEEFEAQRNVKRET